MVTARARAQMQVDVRAVVNRWDPEGLLALDAPGDEYEPEIRAFGALLAQGVTINAEVVEQVWEQWLGPGSGFVRSASRAELAAFADELNQVAAESDRRGE